MIKIKSWKIEVFAIYPDIVQDILQISSKYRNSILIVHFEENLVLLKNMFLFEQEGENSYNFESNWFLIDTNDGF